MKILIINEYKTMGGTEVQTFREYDIFASKGHDVYVLTFDPNEPRITQGHHQNYPLNLNILKKIRLRTWGSKKYKKDIEKIINEITPDVIHINNLLNLPFEVLSCVKNIPAVQTIRDYAAICPKKGICIHKDGTLCKGYMIENCSKCVGLSLEYRFRLQFTKKYNAARIDSINCFVSPSKALADACTANGIPTQCLNNPFDFSKISIQEKNKVKKIYFYYGMIAEHKGVDKLFKVFSEFKKECDAELWIAGKVDPAYKERFGKLIEVDFAKYLGVKKYTEIMDIYKQIYCVIVPSLWIENYPNTVLEALANKTLVIGSNRGGIPELIQNQNFCFDIQDENSFLNCLKRSFYVLQDEYDSITQQGFERIKENNSLEKYYERLMAVYNGLLEINKNVK